MMPAKTALPAVPMMIAIGIAVKIRKALVTRFNGRSG